MSEFLRYSETFGGFSYMLSDGLKRFLSEIESDNLTVSYSEIITFDFHCL